MPASSTAPTGTAPTGTADRLSVVNRADTPDDAVYVGPGSDWANPVRRGTVKRYLDKDPRRPGCRRMVSLIGTGDPGRDAALYEQWLLSDNIEARATRRRARAVLAGKDLACSCPALAPCHAEALIRVAATRPETPARPR